MSFYPSTTATTTSFATAAPTFYASSSSTKKRGCEDHVTTDNDASYPFQGERNNKRIKISGASYQQPQTSFQATSIQFTIPAPAGSSTRFTFGGESQTKKRRA